MSGLLCCRPELPSLGRRTISTIQWEGMLWCGRFAPGQALAMVKGPRCSGALGSEQDHPGQKPERQGDRVVAGVRDILSPG